MIPERSKGTIIDYEGAWKHYRHLMEAQDELANLFNCDSDAVGPVTKMLINIEKKFTKEVPVQ